MPFSRSAAVMVLATLLALTCSAMVGITPERASVETPGTPMGTAEVPGSPPETCPVTRPPALTFVPPTPYPVKPPSQREFWFGTEKLWSMLPVD